MRSRLMCKQPGTLPLDSLSGVALDVEADLAPAMRTARRTRKPSSEPFVGIADGTDKFGAKILLTAVRVDDDVAGPVS